MRCFSGRCSGATLKVRAVGDFFFFIYFITIKELYVGDSVQWYTTNEEEDQMVTESDTVNREVPDSTSG